MPLDPLLLLASFAVLATLIAAAVFFLLLAAVFFLLLAAALAGIAFVAGRNTKPVINLDVYAPPPCDCSAPEAGEYDPSEEWRNN